MPAGLLTNSRDYRNFLLGKNLPSPFPDEIIKGNYQAYYDDIGRVNVFPNPSNPENVRTDPENTLDINSFDRLEILVNLNKFVPENGYEQVDINDTLTSINETNTNRIPYTKKNFALVLDSGSRIGNQNPLDVSRTPLTTSSESKLAIESKNELLKYINIKKSTFVQYSNNDDFGITDQKYTTNPESTFLNLMGENLELDSNIPQEAVGWQEYNTLKGGDAKLKSQLDSLGINSNTQLSTEERAKSLLEYTKAGAKKNIFLSLSYNKYKPSYITDDDTGVLGDSPPNKNYYIGDENSTNLKGGVSTELTSEQFNESDGSTKETTVDSDFNWEKGSNEFNEKTILYKTQEIVNNEPDKAFINQTDKFFKDSTANKYVSKGSGILSDENNPTSFCRVWTKEDEYSYENAIRRRGLDNPFGISIFGKAHLSVLGKNGMVKTHPTKFDRLDNYKKYMLSIENLAWADHFSDLPECEQGPGDQISGNRGRIMWFAPYDLQFDENVNTNYTPTEFLGRVEPIYTYNNTKRSGQLRFKMLVDHPSVINAYRGRRDKLLEQFFSGCKTIEDINDYIKAIKTISNQTKRAIENKLNENQRQKSNSTSSGTAPNDTEPDALSRFQTAANIIGDVAGDILTIDECDYFDVIDDKYPTYFDGISDRIRYFHPSFHSTTPCSFNKRLNFLHQCSRPGPSVYSDNDEIKPQNLSFGRPPICILRIGDFFYSKVVINSISINYAGGGGAPNWDMNPEGIGVQPMFADVNLSIDIIGGQTLNGPINRLQNALSFNFYANTELCDDRADTITLDGSGSIKDGRKPNQKEPEDGESNKRDERKAKRDARREDRKNKKAQEKDQKKRNDLAANNRGSTPSLV
jgi:hypothetical protein